MTINFFEHQDTVAQNLITFIRLKGYSKLSLSKLTGISRPTIDQILKCESPNQTTYNAQITKINEVFGLREDFFLTAQPVAFSPALPFYAFSDHGSGSERSPQARELLEGLDNVLDIYSMYLK
ncbi:transcriptional regulator with XRE-family HTH domain [Paenibacillus forsythiae]|uniref:Transcriptional regulator with XRE-family HTH domain n=1 Tax=Paenibacillus forsythiae TaxID=365616 RepID=A0ABU3HGA8_9BACL|nr:hypothetical protein [Paenibacillus forsythiae]MDT3428715.1 transcriptional regulator with XRE-family HTH domain [Paenibacillus forsythiae]